MFDRVEADRLKEFAEHLATQAAQLVWTDRLRAAGGPYRGARTKSTPTDFVTRADLVAERFIREQVAFHCPNDTVVGEEAGGRHGAPGHITWVVDPLSGTANFVYGLPTYGVSVAAVLDDLVLAGAVAEPHSGRIWSAGLGQGARLHDPVIADDWLEIRVGSTQRLDEALIATGFSRTTATRTDQADVAARLLPQVADLRHTGSPALQLCHVAAGWIDGYFEHQVPLWEWAAGLLIAEEAGATVHWPGRCGPGTGLGDPVLAATPGIAGALVDALAQTGAAAIRRTGSPPPSWPTVPHRTA